MAQQTQDDVDREKAAQMRQMLAAENREAVAHRFGEDSLQSAEFRQAEKDLAQQRSQARKRREEAMAGDADVAQEQVAEQAAQQQRDAQMEAQAEAQRQAELEAQRQAEAEREAQLEREQQRQVEQTQQEQVEHQHEERQTVEAERDRREDATEKQEKEEVQQKAERREVKEQSPSDMFSAKARAARERDTQDQDRGLGR
ncbi:colicin import membrane protein [Propionibacteriaceae bacterium ES.041]|nr:colicin import membrane protein [Propionibacteriaceae bacterium ES.041]